MKVYTPSFHGGSAYRCRFPQAAAVEATHSVSLQLLMCRTTSFPANSTGQDAQVEISLNNQVRCDPIWRKFYSCAFSPHIRNCFDNHPALTRPRLHNAGLPGLPHRLQSVWAPHIQQSTPAPSFWATKWQHHYCCSRRQFRVDHRSRPAVQVWSLNFGCGVPCTIDGQHNASLRLATARAASS